MFRHAPTCRYRSGSHPDYFRFADHSDIDPVKSMHSLKSRVMCRAEPLFLNRTIDKPKQSFGAAYRLRVHLRGITRFNLIVAGDF